MLQRVMHVFSGFVLVFLWGVQAVSAVSFERLDVASHIGEPFYAEAGLRLDGEESLLKTTVALGSASDYRILEVYRDQVVNNLRVDVVDDERGPRVTLSSGAAIDTAFFNLVLKVRYGRSTHYKKIPVFLEAAAVQAIKQNNQQPVSIAAPVNSASVQAETSDAFITKVPEGAKAAFDEPVEVVEASNAFKPYAEWARTARYGPMVFGDTITTVAQRLRVDERFSNQQVMVALFEKNKKEFAKNNINLIRAGTYLDVPTAEEVNRTSPEAAKQVLSAQTKAWKAMLKQPKYAAVADAQRTRYLPRVRVGKNASGVASAPMLAPEVIEENKKAETVSKTERSPAVDPAVQNRLNNKLKVAEEALVQKNEAYTALQEKMAAMEQRLTEAEQKTNEAKAALPQSPANADSAALDAQNKRLEIVISRLKNQLEEAKVNAQEGGAADWLMYALAGLGLLVLALIAAIVLLFRREPKHPAQTESMHDFDDQPIAQDDVEAINVETFNEESVTTKAMDAGDFEMPVETPVEKAERNPALDDMFTDTPLEEIPDFTDDETGEMEPFNADSDEMPDPSVNYLEEADVYLRYGMEDEAEKQVRMALKLEPDNPEAHAKLVQMLQAKGDKTAEENAMSAAQAVLTGTALASFEGLLSGSGEAEAQEESDLEALKHESFDGADTGIIDFGEINFGQNGSGDDAAVDVESADENILVDSELDSHHDVMEQEPLDTGELDFGDLSSAADELEADLDDISSDIMDPETLDTGELDFGNLSGAAGELETDLADMSNDVMEPKELDTGELDFGDLEEAKAELDNVDVSSNDKDVMESKANDTGELDFGDLTEAENVSPDGFSLDDSIDFSAINLGDTEADDVMESSLFDTEELDFSTSNKDKSSAESQDIDFDFSDMANLDAESSDATEQSLDDTDELEGLELLDIEDVSGITEPGDTFGLEEPSSLGAGLDFGLDSFDEDSTAQVSFDKETMVVSPDTSVDASGIELNDYELDKIKTQLEEDKNAAAVPLDASANDPFSMAKESLAQAETEDISKNWDEHSIDNLLGQEEDVLSLDENTESHVISHDGVLTDVDLEMIDLENSAEDKVNADLEGLESISLDLSTIGYNPDDSLDASKEAVADKNIEGDVPSVETSRSVHASLHPEVDLDAEFLSTIGDDLAQLTDPEAAVSFDKVETGPEQETGELEGFDLDDFNIEDLNIDNIEMDSLDEISQGENKVDKFDSTVILDQVTKDMEDLIGEEESGSHFSSVEDALGDSTVIMDRNKDPMSDAYSATTELEEIGKSIDSIGKEAKDPMTETMEATSELDVLMNDLKGLLDEDEPKK